MREKLNIFVRQSPCDILLKVLSYSIKSRTSSRVRIKPHSKVENVDFDFQNGAIYLDYNAIVLSNIQELFDLGHFTDDWKCLDRVHEDMKCLYYAKISTRPWLNWDNPNGAYWFRELSNAIDSGFITGVDIQEAVKKKHIRPSIVRQLILGEEDSTKLSKDIRDGDQDFLNYHKGKGYNN